VLKAGESAAVIDHGVEFQFNSSCGCGSSTDGVATSGSGAVGSELFDLVSNQENIS
jgi:hypothetical protein